MTLCTARARAKIRASLFSWMSCVEAIVTGSLRTSLQHESQCTAKGKVAAALVVVAAV